MRKYYLGFLLLLFSHYSTAESVIKDLQIYEKEQIIYVNVDTTVDFSETVVEAIRNGLTLHVNYTFKFYETNWYQWLAFAELEKNYIISYDSLSTIFTLENPVTGNIESFNNIKLLLSKIGTLRDFPLISNSHIQDKTIEAQVKFKLNTENLPVFLKADILLSSDWDIDSDWYQWQIN